VDVQAESQT